jgi:hypothetical protein
MRLARRVSLSFLAIRATLPTGGFYDAFRAFHVLPFEPPLVDSRTVPHHVLERQMKTFDREVAGIALQIDCRPDAGPGQRCS